MASILVVDDNHETTRPLARLLQYMGHEVHTVDSGQAALIELESWHPTMMLLDISMPGMDGLQLLREVRKNPEWAELRVVMYTALSDENRRKQAMDLGARDYLVKGLTGLGELQSRIARQLN